MKRITIVFLALFLVVPLYSQEELSIEVKPDQQVKIDQSCVRIIHSNFIGQDYRIKIWFPSGYNPEKKYPVLYVLDGDHAFAMATDIVQYLNYGDHIPEIIIVSPSYESKAYPEDGGKNMRNRDYITENGRENYFKFLEKELIPYINKEYNTLREEKAIWGYSNSGAFVMWSLFQEPTLFNRYIAIDPRTSFATDSEAEFAKHNKELNVRLFLGIGSRNGNEISKFIDILKSRNYKNLKLEYLSLQGEEHFVIPGIGLTLGLKAVYKKESLAEAMLQSIKEKGIDSAILDYKRWKDTQFKFYDNNPEVLLYVSDVLGQLENSDAQTKLDAFYDQEYPQRQITFVVTSYTVPPSANIYITGNHNSIGNWNPSFVMLFKNSDGNWEKTFILRKGTKLEYKFTLGSWESEALNKNGNIQPNSFLEIKSDTTLNISIDSWKN